jgi:hypothetical protein
MDDEYKPIGNEGINVKLVDYLERSGFQELNNRLDILIQRFSSMTRP